MTMSLRVTCLCGKITVNLHGGPAARANCHCSSCRTFYGTSMFSATAWAADAVSVDDGAGRTFKHPEKQLTKTFCDVCGEVMFGTNRLGMRVVPNALVARATDGKLDAALAPTMHLFYRQRVVDVSDDLPKYLDGWDGPTYAR
ncbi:GFA family protein [Paraburkholderia sp. BR10872]|uniref:GFA family protein n=1 Tax=Paraburkholderia sp. BR10872 TaxID=3236989 RepID=UPI0034D163FF